MTFLLIRFVEDTFQSQNKHDCDCVMTVFVQASEKSSLALNIRGECKNNAWVPSFGSEKIIS